MFQGISQEDEETFGTEPHMEKLGQSFQFEKL